MEKEISLKYLLETLRSAFKVIFMVTITTFVLSLIYAVQATKLYTAQVVLFPGENLNSDLQQESRKKMLANKSQDYSFIVLDPAVIPEDKTSPQRLLIVIGFTFLALLFSTLGVLIRDYILRQLKD